MANEGIQVGLNPKPITFHYVLGWPLSFSMTYRVLGVATAWPSAPILFFGDPDTSDTFSKTAVLSPADSVNNSRATWDLTSLEIQEIDELPDESAAVVVQGLPWWLGQAVRHG
jgi:hypothetical protein